MQTFTTETKGEQPLLEMTDSEFLKRIAAPDMEEKERRLREHITLMRSGVSRNTESFNKEFEHSKSIMIPKD